MTTWHIINAATDAIVIVDEQRRTVCEISREEGVTPEDDVHARLIAKAPELTEACKRLLKFNEELCADVGVSKHYPSADFARKILAQLEE